LAQIDGWVDVEILEGVLMQNTVFLLVILLLSGCTFSLGSLDMGFVGSPVQLQSNGSRLSTAATNAPFQPQAVGFGTFAPVEISESVSKFTTSPSALHCLQFRQSIEQGVISGYASKNYCNIAITVRSCIRGFMDSSTEINGCLSDSKTQPLMPSEVLELTSGFDFNKPHRVWVLACFEDISPQQHLPNQPTPKHTLLDSSLPFYCWKYK
jgi:hypothetical protein